MHVMRNVRMKCNAYWFRVPNHLDEIGQLISVASANTIDILSRHVFRECVVEQH
jgi:hypothetical protein